MILRSEINVRPVRLPLGPTGFARVSGVSRETLSRLSTYVDLLEHWNRRINLVSRNTMGDVWRRHILDAAQLYPLLPPRTRVLVDLGSGAGIPGLILAAMGVSEVHLIESDQRKAVFLREAIRVMDVPAVVHPERIEKTPPFGADVITARALADLSDLLDLSEKFLSMRSLCLFLKGESVGEELSVAQTLWTMKIERLPSRSDPTGSILKLEALRRGTP
jgi:16S rRNA (guanine527-N7)-methyltransferase